MSEASTKKRKGYAGAIMSLDMRGRLVADEVALKATGIMSRQFKAANRLQKALAIKSRKLVQLQGA